MAEKEEEKIIEVNEEQPAEKKESGNAEKNSKKDFKKLKNDLDKANKQLEDSEKNLSETKDRYLRLAAEYDNYKKRTQKEIDARYSDARFDILKSILPVIDNFERALAAFPEDDPNKEGVALIFKQFTDILAANGVKEIDALGATFDPVYHNAVMHIDDPSLGENIIVDVFEKGYMTEDGKVLRYSMVRVAN